MASVPKMMTFQVAFVVIQILTTVVSKEKGNSIDAIVDNMIGWTSVFFVASWLFLKPGRVERWATYMCWACVFLCFIGIGEAKLEHPVWLTCRRFSRFKTNMCSGCSPAASPRHGVSSAGHPIHLTRLF